MKRRKIYSCCGLLLLCGLFPALSAYSQQPVKSDTIRGTVRNAATGKPLAGINISVQGISSAITEEDGTYAIYVPSTHLILEVSGFGYTARDISARGRGQIDISLYEKEYKGARKEVYTATGEYASTRLANDLEVVRENNDLSVAVTPDVLMQGYASGVNTAFRSGMPGSGANIYLRGFNTLNAGNTPLFIIDGLPFENTAYASSLIGNYQANPLASIDIKDIESITVMKDGLSIYGLKGANGAILIKTLNPKDPETKINAHIHTGISLQPDKLPVLNAAQHRNLLADVIQSQTSDPLVVENLPFFDSRVPVIENWGIEGNKDYYRYNHNTDWQKQVYDSKWNQDYYLNVSGGDAVAQYMLSIGFLDQAGTLKNTHFQRFNTRFNSSIRLSKTVNFSSNMSFVYGTKNLANEGADSRKNPIFAALLKSPFTTSHVYNEEGKLSPNEEPADIFGNSNPYVLTENVSMVNINYRFMGSFELAWNISKHLSVANMLGLNFNKEREKIFYPSTGIYFDPINDVLISNESQHRVDRLFSLYNDLHADYKTQITPGQRLNVRAGFRYQSNEAENDFGEGYNSSSDNFKSIQYGQTLLRQIGGSIGSWNWLSAYAVADYSLMNKYFVNASLASDATSRSGEDASTFFTYPSVAAAWLISGEEFMQNSVIDLLKLRLSYGLSGNDDIGNYNALRYYRTQNMLGAYGIVRGNLVNTSLKPETVKRLNAGLDVSALDERLNLSLNVYRNTTKDMILLGLPERMTGFGDYLSNAGSMQNTGFDFSLNARILNKDLKWDLGLIVSKYKNKALDLKGETYSTEVLGAVVQTKEGQALGQFYGYKTNGVYATQAEANAHPLYMMQGLVPVQFQAGDVRFVNQNTDNLINEDDKVVIGDPNPDVFGSISNTFRYKQWTLNALAVYSLGNDVYNYTRSQLENLSTFNNQSRVVLNRWRYEGDVTGVPRAVYGDPVGNSRFSDRWIEDGSYIRLKSALLSYDLNLKYKLIQNCTLFLTGENLLTLTRYKGLDPEFALGQNPLYQGVDACVVAQPRTVSVGIKLSL
ncbi:SusC/RagA family TonB-linked outer membrane protein [Viscerimonas tarda]